MSDQPCSSSPISVRLASADKRRLAGARQAEEDRALAVGADIGRAVHRHHALRRKQEVQQAEHALLHLARIFGVADQDHLLGEVDRDHRVAAAAVALGIGLEAGQVDDRIFGHEAGQLVGRRAHQQGADEQIVPRHLRDDADVDAIFGLAAAVTGRRRTARPGPRARPGNRP